MKLLISLLPALSRLLASVTPILLLFFFTKFSSTEEIGLVNYFISLITIVGIFTDFGLPEAMQRFLPQTKQPKKIIFSALVIEFIVVFGGMFIILGLDLLTAGEISKGYRLLLLLSLIFSAAHVVTVTFNGLMNDFKTSVYFTGMSVSFIVITLFTYFLLDKNATEAFLIGRLISWILFTIIPFVDLLKQDLIEFKFQLPKRFYEFAFNTFISTFAYALFTQWDSILITNELGEFGNGVYKSVMFIASMPLALRVILETKLLPEYSKMYASKQYVELRNNFIKLTGAIVAAVLIMMPFAILLDEPVLKIFYNQTIAERSNVIFPLGLLATFLYIASIPGISALQAIGKERIVRNIAIIQSILFVSVSYIFFDKFGTDYLPGLLVAVNILFAGVIIYSVFKDKEINL